MVNKSDIIAWIEEMSDESFKMFKEVVAISGYDVDFSPLFSGNPLWEKLANEFSDEFCIQDFDEDDCDYEVGFDPYLGCFSDDC